MATRSGQASRHGLEIRAATDGDAPGLAELLAQAGHPMPSETLATRLNTMRRLPGTVLLALEWGPPSGVIALHWFQTMTQPKLTAQITMLFVAPEGRRRGLGRVLVKAASQTARVAGCDTLEMQLCDTGGFAEAAGFAVGSGSLVRPLRKKG